MGNITSGSFTLESDTPIVLEDVYRMVKEAEATGVPLGAIVTNVSAWLHAPGYKYSISVNWRIADE